MANPTPPGPSQVPKPDVPKPDVPKPELSEPELSKPELPKPAVLPPAEIDQIEPLDSNQDESTPASTPASDLFAATVPTRMSPRARRAALVAAVAAAVVLTIGLIWVASNDGDPNAGGSMPAVSQQPPQFGPANVDVASLKEQQAALGRPIYWAGDPGTKQLELTVTADGGNTLRYLSRKKADASSARAVAMYPMTDAYSAAESASRRVGAITHGVAGGIVVGNTDNAYNGYLALKDLPFLIEVFDPKPGQAWRLLAEGKVVPVPS